MSRKLNWLDKFAEEQAKKERTASKKAVAEQVIVNPSDVPGVTEGEEVMFNDARYKVVSTSYQDEIGEGVILEACSNKEASLDPMTMEMGATVENKTVKAPEMARTNPGNVYENADVRDVVETEKFNQEADETATKIENEKTIDMTTPDGRYNRGILQKIMNTTTEETVEEIVEEEVVVEETTEECCGEENCEHQVEIEAAEDCCGEENCEHQVNNEVVAEMTEEVVEASEECCEEQPVLTAATKARINKIASDVCDAVEAEIEEVLEHAELVVKEFVPARFVKRTLSSLETALEEEGVNCKFDKKVTREALRRTAGQGVSNTDIKEFIEEIVKAMVEEIEEVLADTDEVLFDTIEDFEEKSMVEASLKGKIERKMKSMGVNCRLERKRV